MVVFKMFLWLSSTGDKGKVKMPVESEINYNQFDFAWAKLRSAMNVGMDVEH